MGGSVFRLPLSLGEYALGGSYAPPCGFFKHGVAAQIAVGEVQTRLVPAQGEQGGLAEVACARDAHGVGADGDADVGDVLPKPLAIGGEQVLGGDV